MRRRKDKIHLAIVLGAAGSMFGAEQFSFGQSCVQTNPDCRVLKWDCLPDLPSGAQTFGLNGYFNFGEQLNLYYTAPCDGDITEIHVLWAAEDGIGGIQNVQQQIALLDPAGFPNPGNTALMQGAFEARLDGPALETNGYNIFKFLDEGQTTPLAVPVTSGQQFVVQITFGEDYSDQCAAVCCNPAFTYPFCDPNPPLKGACCSDPSAPTIPVDLNGCTWGKASILAFGFGIQDSCALGVEGDWVVRVVFDGDCPPAEGACETGPDCIVMSEIDCICLGGIYHGDGSSSCGGSPTTGACCFGGGGCLELTEAQCDIANGTFTSLGTLCTPGLCVSCPSDTNDDGVVSVVDLLKVLEDWGNCPGCPGDVDDDNFVGILDLLQVLSDWGPCS